AISLQGARQPANGGRLQESGSRRWVHRTNPCGNRPRQPAPAGAVNSESDGQNCHTGTRVPPRQKISSLSGRSNSHGGRYRSRPCLAGERATIVAKLHRFRTSDPRARVIGLVGAIGANECYPVHLLSEPRVLLLGKTAVVLVHVGETDRPP